MRGHSKLLFSELDLRRVLENVNNRTKQEVDNISEAQFSNSSDDEIVEHIASICEVTPLELHEDRMTMETQETQVDVRHDFRRAVFDKSKPCMVPAVGVTVEIPFTGDVTLWKCQPSTFTLNPPQADIRCDSGNESGQLVLPFTQPADSVQGDQLKREIDSQLESIRSYLTYIRRDVEACNSGLRGNIRCHVSKRRERLGKFASIAKVLDIPLKHKP